MRRTIPLWLALLLTGCIGAAYSPTPYDPVVWAYNDALAAPYFPMSNPDGVSPCGIFDVRGHGHKIAHLGEFPACDASNYGVYCLTGDGSWTNQFMSEIELDADGETLRFQSAQDGLCGLFPAE